MKVKIRTFFYLLSLISKCKQKINIELERNDRNRITEARSVKINLFFIIFSIHSIRTHTYTHVYALVHYNIFIYMNEA